MRKIAIVGKVGSVPPLGVFAIPTKKIQTAARFATANIVKRSRFILIARGILIIGPNNPKVVAWITKKAILQYFMVCGDLEDENFAINSLSVKYLKISHPGGVISLKSRRSFQLRRINDG